VTPEGHTQGPWDIIRAYCPKDVQEWVRTNVTFEPMFPGDLRDGEERNGAATPPELRTDGRWGIHYRVQPEGYSREYVVLHEVAHARLGHKRADADVETEEREAYLLANVWLDSAGGGDDDDAIPLGGPRS
jgi:hypothetical protein